MMYGTFMIVMTGKKLRANRIRVSVGVFAHNEEKNVEGLLKSILRQRTKVAWIKEILVISSGSHDKTNRMVRELRTKDGRIRLLEEHTRRGKSAAINKFLRVAKEELVVTISADLRLAPTAIEEIVLPFLNEDVGMAGARPKPVNVRGNSIGKEIALLWELHHQISLIKPKCGEMVAFRNIVKKIPREALADEATLEVLLTLLGYGVVYAPRSVVYNRGPLSVTDYIRQRRKIFVGHQWVAKRFNYRVVTMQWEQIMKAVVSYLLSNPGEIRPLVRLIMMEAMAQGVGWIDYHVLEKNPFVWKMVSR